jgi:nucleoid DNA-binding protein
MAKSTVSNKAKDTLRSTKTRARKTATRVSQPRATSAQANLAKVSRTKAAMKGTPKDAAKEVTKTAKKASQKGNGQAARLKAIRMKQTKAQIVQTITEETGLARKDVARVMATLATLAKRHVMKRGSGEFSIPELGVKVRRVQRKARMARNPMTGEPVRVPAKTAVKASVLKALKDAVL